MLTLDQVRAINSLVDATIAHCDAVYDGADEWLLDVRVKAQIEALTSANDRGVSFGQLFAIVREVDEEHYVRRVASTRAA